MGVSVDVPADVSVGLSVDASVDKSVDVFVGVAVFLINVFHTSRALTGSPLAVPSRGPRGIPSLVVEITLDCRCNYRDCREIAVN